MTADAEKVRAAADYIERVGLFKGHLADPELVMERFGVTPHQAVLDGRAIRADVPCCTLGALYAFCGEGPAWGLRGDLLGHIGTALSMAGWNDAPERTADEVVTALRSFADTLDAQP